MGGAGAEAYVEGGPPGVTDVGGGVYVGGPAPKNGGAVVVGAGLLAPVPGGPPEAPRYSTDGPPGCGRYGSLEMVGLSKCG